MKTESARRFNFIIASVNLALSLSTVSCQPLAVSHSKEVSCLSEQKVNPIKWRAPSRPFKPRNKKYFTTIGVTILVLGLILILVREFLLIGVIIALAFVSYALATVKPEEVEHEVTDEGVKTGKDTYKWEDLTGFFFSEQWGFEMVNFNTKKKFPGRLMLLLGNQPKEELEKFAVKYITKNEAPKKGFGEKALEKIGSKLNLE